MFVAVGLEEVRVVRGVIVMVVKAEVENPREGVAVGVDVEGMSVWGPEPELASARLRLVLLLLLTRPVGMEVE